MSMQSEPIRVLLVDDHPVVRAGYRRLLDSTPNIQVVAEAESGEEGYAAYGQEKPDVVIMDLSMPGIGGLEATRRILARHPEARVLVFSVYDNEAMLSQAMKLGVRGYLSKRSAPQIMMDAIVRVSQGQMYVDPELIATVVAQNDGEKDDPLSRLTPREFEIFRFLADGHSVAEIADILSISPKTAGVHHTRIMHKLGAKNRGQLVRMAVSYGIVNTVPMQGN